MWDNKRHFGFEQFQRHVAEVATMYFCGQRSPIVDGKHYSPLWWTSSQIRIFWEPGISDATVELVRSMLERRAAELGLKPFIFQLYGSHASSLQQLSESLVKGQIDENKFFDICLSEIWRDTSRGGIQHADVLITQKEFLNDPVSWGAASWSHGTMLFTLHGNRQHNRSFLRKVALHEANHLFGMPLHCDHHQNVEGYRYDDRCNMHYSCPTEELCPKCKDFIRFWWEQIEEECAV